MNTTFLDYDRRLREDVYADWPIIAEPLGWSDLCLGWQMEYYERTALIGVLSGLRPDVAIEVGTASGGSLAVMARYSRHVHTLDIKAESGQLLAGRFPNVTYVVGDSKETLPPILAELQRTQKGPTFLFVDGDHSAASVRADLTMMLSFRPKYPTVLMGHDSFNPGCREGILRAPWSQNPHVHLVEIDFVKGSIFDRASHRMEMWGGFYFALLMPEPRTGSLTVSERHRLLFDLTRERSVHSTRAEFTRQVRYQASRPLRKARHLLAKLTSR